MDLSTKVLRRKRKPGVEAANEQPPTPHLIAPSSPMWPYYARRVLARQLTVEMGMRLMGSRMFNGNTLARYTAHGLDINDVQQAMEGVRGARGWVDGWRVVADQRAAQGEALLAAGNNVSASRCLLYASLCYHFAQVILFGKQDVKHEMHKLAVAAYAKAAPHFDPPALPVSIPFGEHILPGYLRLPHGVERPPVVVNMNGVSMIKEEFHVWEAEMLARGIATLSFDGPGSGESWYAGVTMVQDYCRVSTAILDFLAGRDELDGTRVGLMGVSMGGYLSLWMASDSDPRYRAVVTLCAPYNLARDYQIVMPLVRHEIQFLFNFNRKQLHQMLRQPIAKGGLATKVKAATLVIAGGADMIVPPRNARLIYNDLAGEKDLLYFPKGGHICYNVTADVRIAAADWLVKHLTA